MQKRPTHNAKETLNIPDNMRIIREVTHEVDFPLEGLDRIAALASQCDLLDWCMTM